MYELNPDRQISDNLIYSSRELVKTKESIETRNQSSGKTEWTLIHSYCTGTVQ